jgi:hypothetical protein
MTAKSMTSSLMISSAAAHGLNPLPRFRMDGSEDLDDFSLLGGFQTSQGAYAAANFNDAQDTRPPTADMEAIGANRDTLQGLAQMILQRHMNEAVPAQTSPSLTSFNTNRNNWRKRLREMMLHQDEQVFNFLFKPAQEHATVGPVQRALERYAIRETIDQTHVRSLREILDGADIDGALQVEIAAAIAVKGPSSITEIREQVSALIELYKETGEKVLEAEGRVKMALEKMDKLQKRVCTLIELQTNSATPDLVAAVEKYMKVAFETSTIESSYKALVVLYKKHLMLREAIQVFKTGATLPAEPICPICITDPVGCAIVPCGHTFCMTCARRMVSECSVCRTRIRERMKLFFS